MDIIPEITPMTLDDYDELIALWRATEGVWLGEADSREGIARYLARNPGLSLVARAAGRIVGAVMCGHDGRRGILYHLAVDPAWRRRGLARALADRCVAGLAAEEIDTAILFVIKENESGRRFWEAMGWELMDYVHPMRRVPK